MRYRFYLRKKTRSFISYCDHLHTPLIGYFLSKVKSFSNQYFRCQPRYIGPKLCYHGVCMLTTKFKNVFFQNARKSRYTLHNIVLHRGYSQAIVCYQIDATSYATLTNGSELYLRLEMLRTDITKYAWCYFSFKRVDGRYMLKHWPRRFQSHIINQSNFFEAGNKTCSTNFIGVFQHMFMH